MVNYMGIFFDKEQSELIMSLQPTKLEKVNDEVHCTFKYKPTNSEISMMDEIVGQEVDVFLIGYGCDGKNSGFEVAFDEYYDSYYVNYDTKLDSDGKPVLKTKHITASLAEGAKAAATKDLVFVKLAEPVKVTGKFGYWIVGKDIESHKSFERFFDEPSKTL